MLPSCSEHPWQPGEVANGHREHEAGADPFDAAVTGLGRVADRFAPAERPLDPLSVLLGQSGALVSFGLSNTHAVDIAMKGGALCRRDPQGLVLSRA